MMVKVPFYTQVYWLYGTQYVYSHSLGSTCPPGPSWLLCGQSQMLLVLSYFLTLLAVSASCRVRAGLWFVLCCAHCGENHSSSEAEAPPDQTQEGFGSSCLFHMQM